jgi:hypothetical protein
LIIKCYLTSNLVCSATDRQRKGFYRCNSVYVDFGDAAWEEARIKNDNTERLLIYSHFNGIYEEEGHYNNRPRYVERNKEKGVPFKRIVPAEIGEISRGLVILLIFI